MTDLLSVAAGIAGLISIGIQDQVARKAKDLELGNIHVHTREVVARFFDMNKEWTTDYEDLMQMLSSAGLVHYADPPPPDSISYIYLHPLLPYMIRYEIASHPLPNPAPGVSSTTGLARVWRTIHPLRLLCKKSAQSIDVHRCP
jgi:hypothetical protein